MNRKGLLLMTVFLMPEHAGNPYFVLNVKTTYNSAASFCSWGVMILCKSSAVPEN